MEGLAGDFGTMPVQDLVLYLGNRNLTGTLVCERGPSKKSVIIRDGQATNAASNDPREYLGQFLINFGHIGEDQLTRAFQTQAETKIFLGKILVMIGAVTEDTIRQVLAIKIRETLLEVFRWSDGNFKFARNVIPKDLPGVEVSVPLLDIHREGEFRETAWQAMLQVFPQGTLALEVDEAKVPKELVPESLEARLFQAIREGQTIDEISLSLHATDFHLYQRLYALYRQGVVTTTEARPRVAVAAEDAPLEVTVGEELSADDILRVAKEFIAEQRFAEAETLAQRAAEVAPSPEVSAVLREAETGLANALRTMLLSEPHVPKLAIEPSKFKTLDLSPPEKYLLSRIDGARDLKAIIRVSPLRELDALRYFQRFLEAGYITLE